MRAIRQHQFGPPESLVYGDVADPLPGVRDVRIAVEAAGEHVIDAAIRAGAEGLPFPLPSLPMTPGREVAGVVEGVGPGLRRGGPAARDRPPRAGERGLRRAGGPPAKGPHELPDDLDAAAAVAMIGTGRTAVGILDQAGPSAADVLVTAAAGGLGTLLVQGARRRGRRRRGWPAAPRRWS
jgi:NADPH:quinone reductase